MPGPGDSQASRLSRFQSFLFASRSYTPIPLILLSLVFARSNAASVLLGLTIVVVGEALRIWGVGYAGIYTRVRHISGDRLVTDGPYAHVRNPLYLGNLLIAVGFWVATWALAPYLLIGLLVAFTLQYGMIIAAEERELRLVLREAYEHYISEVPRMLPNLIPYSHRSNDRMDIKMALRSERKTLQSLIILTVVVTLRWKLIGN